MSTSGSADDREDAPKILVADDDPVVRDLLQSIIEDEGWTCDMVCNGTEAIGRIKRESYDIIITDLQMPGHDGIEVLRTTKETNSHTEVIILTGFSSETAAIHAVRLGAFDYLKKPLSDIDKLPQLVRKARAKQKEAAKKSLAIETLQKEAEELDRNRVRLQKEALTDPLTGLFNRAHFDEVLMAWFTQAEAGTFNVALLLVDLDNFKRTNDVLGHPGGDHVLRMVAGVLLASIRQEDKAFRYGGEEFTVFLHGLAIDSAKEVAERIRKKIEALVFEWEGMQVSVTVSIGLSEFPNPTARRPADLVRQADQAMYRAKRKGKNRVESFLDTY